MSIYIAESLFNFLNDIYILKKYIKVRCLLVADGGATDPLPRASLSHFYRRPIAAASFTSRL